MTFRGQGFIKHALRLVFLVCGFLVLWDGFVLKAFFIRASAKGCIYPVALVLAVLAAAAMALYALRVKRPRGKEHGLVRTMRMLGDRVGVPAFFFCLVLFAIGVSLPGFMNACIGSPYRARFVIKSVSTGYAGKDMFSCHQSAILIGFDHDPWSALCLTDEEAQGLHSGSSILAAGKRSWFGTSIRRVSR